MPGFIQSWEAPFGVTFDKSLLVPVSFTANAGEAFMQVTFARYAGVDHIEAEPLGSFSTTVPLNGHAPELLATLLTIIGSAAVSDTPPSGLEGATPA